MAFATPCGKCRAAKRVGERMHQMRTGMIDSHAAVVRGPQHLQFRRKILRVGHGTLNMPYQLIQAD